MSKRRRSPKKSVATGVPPRHEQQVCSVGGWLFDVEHAFRLLRARPRISERVEVDVWAGMLGLDGNPFSRIVPGPSFDPGYAMTVDLRRPLIMATLRTSASGTTPLIIDGTHRLYRAYIEQIPTLRAYVLTVAETELITRARPTPRARGDAGSAPADIRPVGPSAP